MHFPVTSLVASLLIALVLVLTVHVIRTRGRKGVALLDGGHRELTSAIRAHGNLCEYAPLFLIGLALLEVIGMKPLFLYTLGVVFLLGRISHAYSLIIQEHKPGALDLRFRVSGMIITLSTLALEAVLLLWGSL